MYKTVITRIKVALGNEEIFRTLAQALIENTRQEPGNIVFAMYHSDEISNAYLFYAEYTSDQAYESHCKADYVKRFALAVKPVLEESEHVSVV